MGDEGSGGDQCSLRQVWRMQRKEAATNMQRMRRVARMLTSKLQPVQAAWFRYARTHNKVHLAPASPLQYPFR